MQDHEMLTENHDRSLSTLERVWAATRPVELSSDEFDQIWADVQQAYDCPTVLAMPPSARLKHAIAWLPFLLANAAAIFIAAWVMNRPVEPSRGAPGPQTVQTNPTLDAASSVIAHSSTFELEPYETLVIQIDGKVVQERRDQSEESPLLALNDVQANNQNDTLNHWETLSND